MQASCSAGGGTGLAAMPGWPAWAAFALPCYLLILRSFSAAPQPQGWTLGSKRPLREKSKEEEKNY